MARATQGAEAVTWGDGVGELGEEEWMPSNLAEAAAFFRAQREQ